METAARFDSIQLSLIRQINALATPGSINLGIGEPNLEPDEHLRSLFARAASETSWSYSAIPGAIELRGRISERYGNGPDPETEICVNSGSQEALWAFFQAFVGPGDEVLVPDPGFVAYPALTRLAGAKPIAYALDSDDWSLDFESIDEAISDRTKAIVVNSPSNPTGRTIPADQLRELVELTSDRDILLVSDEVYREIHYDERPETLAGSGKNVVVVSSVSKSHGLTGLRLGWTIASAELMTTLRKAHHYTTTCASTYAQKLVELIFADESWNEAWLERARAQFASQREVAIEALVAGFGHSLESRPDGAFYLFAPVPSCRTLELAKTLAAEHAVLIIPGIAFGNRGEGHLRISYAADHATLREGIARLSHGIDALTA